MNLNDSVSRTSVQLLLTEPFYGHFLMGVPKSASTRTETAAVALMNRQSVQLLINEDFWRSLSAEHRYGLIKHEVLHIVLGHLFTAPLYPNARLFNLAADIVVNQYVAPKQLPEGAVLLADFQQFARQRGDTLEPHRDVGYYYRFLSKHASTCGSTGSSATACGNPGCVTCGGHQDALERHAFWAEVSELNAGERELAAGQTNRMIQQTADRVQDKYRNYGNLPGRLAERLKEILAALKPRVDWRRQLRLFATSSQRSYLKNTIRRPSRRYGTTPGIKVKRRNRLLVAIDTSGSIRQTELNEFFAELYQIWRQGAEIEVVECDVTIQHTYTYRGITPQAVHGRGGTSFEAPIEYANEGRPPDALLYFTDGYAPVPANRARCPILWVLSPRGLSLADAQSFPGRVIKIGDG